MDVINIGRVPSADGSMWGRNHSDEITIDHYNSFFSFSPWSRDRARFRVCGPCRARKRTEKKGVRSDCRLNRVNICTHTHTAMAMVAGPVLFLIFSELFQVDEGKQKKH